MKDMTSMIRPQFKQVHPVDYKFASTMKEIDEFKYEQQVFRYNDLRFTIKIRYFTLYGLVEGDLEFNKQLIQFVANKSQVKDLLMKETAKDEKEINDQLLSKFSFTIHLEDIYSVQQKDKWIQIMLFGIDKIDIPVLDHQNEISVIAIQLLIDQNLSPEITNLIKSLTNGLNTLQGLLGYILQLNRYQNNKKTFRSLVRKCKQSKPYPTMICLSQISYYDIVALSKLGNQHHIDYYQPNISTLNKPSRILSHSDFEFLANNMPEQVTGNKWFQVYNPKFHGISFQELLRRVRNIKEHFIIIKDDQNIFGAYLEQGWHISEHYYGGSQSFVFTFKNNGYRLFRTTKLNNYYQKFNQESLQIGGEEPAILIDYNLLRGETGGSLTFGNELLSSSKFNIQELEIWGVQDDCELVMRHLRLESDFHIDQQ